MPPLLSLIPWLLPFLRLTHPLSLLPPGGLVDRLALRPLLPPLSSPSHLSSSQLLTAYLSPRVPTSLCSLPTSLLPLGLILIPTPRRLVQIVLSLIRLPPNPERLTSAVGANAISSLMSRVADVPSPPSGPLVDVLSYSPPPCFSPFPLPLTHLDCLRPLSSHLPFQISRSFITPPSSNQA